MALDIIGHEFRLIGINHRVDIVDSEVKVHSLLEKSINIFLRGAIIKICSVLARIDSEYSFLINSRSVSALE